MRRKGDDYSELSFHSIIKARRPQSPRLINLIAFRGQQSAFTLSHQFGLCEADFNYFKERGWLDERKQYYTDVKVNPIKNLATSVIGRIARRNMMKELQEPKSQRKS